MGVDETAERLIRNNLIRPLIIVAVTPGEERIHGYAPTPGIIGLMQNGSDAKGLAPEYAHS
jgi:hypothetical protein